MELEYLPESYLSKEEFIDLIRVYEIIQNLKDLLIHTTFGLISIL